MSTVAARLRNIFGRKARRPRPDDDGVTYRPLLPYQERIDAWRTVLDDDDRRRAIYDHVAASVDPEAFAALQEAYRDEVLAADMLAPTKYLDLAPWFMIHSRIARVLDLDRRPPCSILDIGAGGGQFLAIAKSYGHKVVAFDQPHPQVYRDLLALFDIPRVDGSIKLGEPLPASIDRFDLIVINGQVFDVYFKPYRRWETPEWASFLEYLAARHLNLPGQLFIGLNKSAGPTWSEDYYWPIVDLCREHGAEINRKRATINMKLAAPLRFPDVGHIDWLDH